MYILKKIVTRPYSSKQKAAKSNIALGIRNIQGFGTINIILLGECHAGYYFGIID
jgi:hypothetical protein